MSNAPQCLCKVRGRDNNVNPPPRVKHVMCHPDRGCPKPAYPTPSQKQNASLFSGTLNNPGFLSTQFYLYSHRARKVTKASSWTTVPQIVTQRVIVPLKNQFN